MKTWVIVVLIIVFVFVVVPLIYYGITVRNLRKAATSIPTAQNGSTDRELRSQECGVFNTLVAPPEGKRWACILSNGVKSWQLVEVGEYGAFD